MKKLPAPIQTLSLFAAVLLLAVSACKKDSNKMAIDITGKWTLTQFQGIQQYEFKSDQTVEFNIIATDSVTKQVIGYRYKSTGSYTIKNDSLIMFNLKSYTNSKSTYGPATELVPTNGLKTSSYKVSLNNQKNRLSLYFTCPPNADCVPSPMVFNKQ